MKRKSLLKTLYIILALLVILSGIFFLYKNYISADATTAEKIVETKVDLGDLGQKKIRISTGSEGGNIEIERTFSSCPAKLTGFEKDVDVSGVVIAGKKKLIEITGPVGIHAENKQLFLVEPNLCLKAVAFEKNTAIEYNIYSDEPNFLVQDFNSDNYVDIASGWRDYDKDPLVNGFKDIYLFDSSSTRFKFSHREQVEHN